MRKENVGTKRRMIVCINVIWHIVRACNTPGVSPRARRSVQDAHPGSWITVWIFRSTLKKKRCIWINAAFFGTRDASYPWARYRVCTLLHTNFARDDVIM